jgi:HisJ family histidinol phosphate phosphatase
MKLVYHIHDQCCGHATNTLDNVIKFALKDGYKELFFTEHCPLANNKYLWRPSHKQLQNLRKRIDLANLKYKDKLFIHFGYESEYSK